MSLEQVKIIPASEKQITDSYKYINSIILEYFENDTERINNISKLFNDYGIDQILSAPASGKSHFHSSFTGGYLVHVANVIKNTISIYNYLVDPNNNLYSKIMPKIEVYCGVTINELVFSALFHDLYKLGIPGESYYIKNDNTWKKNNMNLEYEINSKIDYMDSVSRTMFLLQKYGITYTENELYGIMLADGLFDESNKNYLISYDNRQRRFNFIYTIIHFADFISSQIEHFEFTV